MDDPIESPVSVYQYHDRAGVLLYVGVTSRDVRRTQEHAETKQWWRLTTGSAIEHYPTRELALERESELIKRYKPPFNTIYNDRKAESQEHYLTKVKQEAPVQNVTTRKQRRAHWYTLTLDERRQAPCIQCGERPSSGRGPECVVCHPSRLSTDGSRISANRTRS